jgi:hypothetical protein
MEGQGTKKDRVDELEDRRRGASVKAGAARSARPA